MTKTGAPRLCFSFLLPQEIESDPITFRGGSDIPDGFRALLEPDAVYFELEGFGATVAGENLNAAQGLAGIVGEIKAVAVADGKHLVKRNADHLPLAACAEIEGISVAVLWGGLDANLVALAVTLEPNAETAKGGNIE